jgi:hypothetical protein
LLRPHLREPNPHRSRFGCRTECALHPTEGVGGRAVSACVFPISPVSAKSVGACAKFKIYLRRCRNETRADICILDGLLFICRVLPSFRFRVLVAASQKNQISAF